MTDSASDIYARIQAVEAELEKTSGQATQQAIQYGKAKAKQQQHLSKEAQERSK